MNKRLKLDFAAFKQYIKSTYETEDAVLFPDLPVGQVFDDDLEKEQAFNGAFSDSKNFTVLMHGPKNSPYEGGVFRFEVVIPTGYPMYPPKVKCKTEIYHPNISKSYVCAETLQDGWSPAMGLKQLFMSLYAIMFAPNSKGTAKTITDDDIAQHEKHLEKVSEHTAKHAAIPVLLAIKDTKEP